MTSFHSMVCTLELNECWSVDLFDLYCISVMQWCRNNSPRSVWRIRSVLVSSQSTVSPCRIASHNNTSTVHRSPSYHTSPIDFTSISHQVHLQAEFPLQEPFRRDDRQTLSACIKQLLQYAGPRLASDLAASFPVSSCVQGRALIRLPKGIDFLRWQTSSAKGLNSQVCMVTTVPLTPNQKSQIRL